MSGKEPGGGTPRKAPGRWILTGALALLLPIAPSAAATGDTRTHLPDHRLGPLQLGRTTEKEAVARLGAGLAYPIPQGRGRCWSEDYLMLCAAFEKGKLTSLSFERAGTLPPRANQFLEGPEGKKLVPTRGDLKARLRPNLFLPSLATETRLRIESTEREVLAALGRPHVLETVRPPFRFIYRSSKENDHACPGECMAVYVLNRERLLSIYLRLD